MTTASLREQKRRATARTLASVSFELAVERGMDGFVIDDVTARAGYSRRTFANHFSCKEDAVAHFVVSAAEDAIRDFGAEVSDEPVIDVLERVVKSQLSPELVEVVVKLEELNRAHPALTPYILATHTAMMQSATAIVARARNSTRTDLDTVLLLNACYGTLSALLTGEVDLRRPGDGPQSPGITVEEFVATAFAKLRSGF